MLGRGRGGVQVLEHLGPEVLKTCTPPRARGNAGDAVFVWCEGNLLLLLRRSNKPISRVGGAGPRTRGSTGFGTFGA